MPAINNQLAKNALRLKIKKLLNSLSNQEKLEQSNAITKKILNMKAFQYAKRVNIYLSTENEVNTIDILKEMFNQNKEVFIPLCYNDDMKMVRLFDFEDYQNLPVTKWNIKEPRITDDRENGLDAGGFDLMILPGMAFTKTGGRCGHGRGYYDKYLFKYFQMYPDKSINNRTKLSNELSMLTDNKTLLVGLAFNEQIVNDGYLPIEQTDKLIDLIITSD